MPAERYFLETDFETGKDCILKESEFHHLAHVTRARKGSPVELVNGRGALAQACVQHIEKDRAVLSISSVYQETRTRCPKIMLAQALPKPNRLDIVIEKGTELGVDTFWLFPGNLSSKKECFPQQLERVHQMTIAAMKQCGRLILPDILFKPSLEQWRKIDLESALIFFGDIDPSVPVFENFRKDICDATGPIVFVTGPESGFSENEIEHLKGLGATGVKLHSNILRTETASLVAISLISHWLLAG